MNSQHITRRPSAALRNAVDAYRAEYNDAYCAGHKKGMEPWARKLLDRLAHSDKAGKAFERLKLKDGREREFVMLCILVAHLARMFPARISSEQKMPAQLRRLDEAISSLRLFVTDQMTRFSDFLVPQPDLLPSWGLCRTIDLPDEFGAMMHGLDLIAELIKKRRRIGEAVMAAWRVTRKKHHKNAENIVAISYLAEGTRTLTGKPHKRELITLAPVILGKLSNESVIYALRAPKKSAFAGLKNA